MAKEKEEKKKVKRSTAKKRIIQSEKKRQHNKAFRSKVSSAMRSFDKKPESLSSLYSLVDKGVKTGVFKRNKANRLKSKLATRA